jgi:hypothetical protein
VPEAIDLVVDQMQFDLAPPEAPRLPEAGTGDGQSSVPAIPVITTPEDLERFLWETWGIRISKHVCCPDKGHRSPWEAFCYAYFAVGPVCIWKASRGFGGKSFQLSLLALTEAVTLRADVKLLGGSGEQAKRVLKYTEDFWELPTAPKQLLDGVPGARKTKLTTGNTIEALMASSASVRGPHPQRLRLDEIDEMKLKILNAAAGQTMSKGWVKSQTVMSSTHHYPKGTFTQKLAEAADRGWPVFEWCYRANLKSVGGFIEDDEIARKRIEVPTAMWDVEYEGQEPSVEGRAFDSLSVKAMFVEAPILADGSRGPHPPEICLEPEPVDGATYGTGADWARKVNHTVITTFRKDQKPRRKLAWLRRGNRSPWPVMIGWFIEQLRRFGGTNRHDRTGLGDVVHQFAEFMGGMLSDDDGVMMVGRDRQDLLSEWILAVERGQVVVAWPDTDDTSDVAQAIRVMKNEHLYATVDDLFKGDKSNGKLPDTVSSAALAWRAVSDVEAAGGSRDPEPPTGGPSSPLTGGIQPGRLSGYIGIQRGRLGGRFRG